MIKSLAPVAALLISMSILLTGQGLHGTLLPVRASLEQFGLQLFVVASVLVSIGAVPVALSTSPIPEQPQTVAIDIKRLFQISPSGAIGCLVAGLANGALWGLAAVFATSLGDDIEVPDG